MQVGWLQITDRLLAEMWLCAIQEVQRAMAYSVEGLRCNQEDRLISAELCSSETVKSECLLLMPARH